jgi:hypothetical protein
LSLAETNNLPSLLKDRAAAPVESLKLESVKLAYLIEEVTGKREKKERIRGEEGKIARTKPLIRYLDRHAV